MTDIYLTVYKFSSYLMENTAVSHYNSEWIDDDMNNGESYET